MSRRSVTPVWSPKPVSAEIENTKYPRRWKDLTQEYFNVSSFHGLKYVGAKNIHWIERTLWLVCFLLAVSGSIFVVLQLWSRYETDPIYIIIDSEDDVWTIPFPSISVCPNHLDRTNITDSLTTDIMNLTYDTLGVFRKHVGQKYSRNMNMRDTLSENVLQCDQVFLTCKFKDVPFDCCSEFRPLLSEVGLCYTFNNLVSGNLDSDYPFNGWSQLPLREAVSEDSSTQLKLEFRDRRIQVLVHTVTGLPLYGQPSFNVNLKQQTFIQLQAVPFFADPEVKELSMNQRKCHLPHELMTSPVVTKRYSPSSCLSRCRMLRAEILCGCSPYFYPHPDGHQVCNVQGLACLSYYHEQLVTHYKDFPGLPSCECLPGCEEMDFNYFDIIYTDSLRPTLVVHLSQLSLKLKRKVLYGLMDLIVGFGGIVGLFLGFSFISLYELVYFFSMRPVCNYWLRRTTCTTTTLDCLGRY